MNLYLWYVLTLILAIVSVSTVFCIIRNDLKKNCDIRSLVTGLVIIPENNNNTEFILRKLAVYIQKNDIHCFRKIVIHVSRDDSENIMICRGLCEQYSFFEVLIMWDFTFQSSEKMEYVQISKKITYIGKISTFYIFWIQGIIKL